VASYYPDEGRFRDEGGESGDSGDSRSELPSRADRPKPAPHTEARAELRDRETYYAELRLAVQSQSRFFPRPRAALDDYGADTWTRPAEGQDPGGTQARPDGGKSTDGKPGAGLSSDAGRQIRSDGESWDDMTARFGDTWT
jgi:hypothetical protein